MGGVGTHCHVGSHEDTAGATAEVCQRALALRLRPGRWSGRQVQGSTAALDARCSRAHVPSGLRALAALVPEKRECGEIPKFVLYQHVCAQIQYVNL